MAALYIFSCLRQEALLAAAKPLFFLQGASPFRSSRFTAAFGRRSLLAAAGSICPCWGTLSPGRAAHPPAFALSGPLIRYLLAFPATGSGGHPCPYGASFGILPLVAFKAGVNFSGPRGAEFYPQYRISKSDWPYRKSVWWILLTRLCCS